MIYTFGDSFTYGFNFSDKDREKSVWPYFFSKKLNLPYQNLSIPGGSNWRIARQICNLDITKNDIVIIAWTLVDRFEFGVNENYKQPSIKKGRIGDLLEENEGYKVKKFYSQLSTRTNDFNAKTFNDLAYSIYYNNRWFEEMFKIMFNSCVQVLLKKNCKWIMFNTWSNQLSYNYDEFDIPQYIFNKTNINSIIRQNNNLDYWIVEEHQKVASLILEEYKKIY